MDMLCEIYGYKIFMGCGVCDLWEWIFGQVEDVRLNEDFVYCFIVWCWEIFIILFVVLIIECLCVDVLVVVEWWIEMWIVENLIVDVCDYLDKFLSEMFVGNISCFIWFCNFEVGNNLVVVNCLFDRFEFLCILNINYSVLVSIFVYCIVWLCW